MSTKYEGNLYDFFDYHNSYTLYANYIADINVPKKINVEILDQIFTTQHTSDIWAVQNCDTQEVFLATSSQLEGIHYYGD